MRWCLSVFLVAAMAPLSVIGQPLSILDDNSYGHLLPSPPGVRAWWCEATYKVGRQRALPSVAGGRAQIEAARNEYEPFQFVLSLERILSNVTVAVTDFIRQGEGPPAVIAATNVEIHVVEYVPVILASDEGGGVGDYPDPLLPLSNPLVLEAGTNWPFWVTVYVPKETPAGNYRADLVVNADGVAPFSCPVELRVFDFTLPDVTHTRTAYYADVHLDVKWHRLSTLSDRRYVWDLYMDTYRRHRVSPYSAHLYAPITWQLEDGKITVDFNDFDAAMERYLDEFGFNAFNLFGHKSPPFPTSLGGYPAFTPEYRVLFARLMGIILGHLREKGWLDLAYCYWVDEPRTDKFPYLLEGMNTLGESAPGVQRLLTVLLPPPVQYDPLLNGNVDIWVPLLPMASEPRYQDRKPAGDELWWYVCAGPSYPYPNLFIDHPAINHRIRFWAGEKYGVTGDLYYAVNQWTGRDPWTQTRTWNWADANGDGTLLYPPSKALPTQPLLAPPNISLRWELTREALEDGEYFWLLKQTVTNAALRLGPEHPMVQEGIAARLDALSLVTNLSTYVQSPGSLHAARRRMAVAIEQLDDGAPWFVRHPKSRAVALGSATTLRAEALGWPSPAYQWRLGGTNLPGATASILALTNCGHSQAGAFTVVASNAFGMATSAVAQIEGYWSEAPRILVHPGDLIRPEGESALLSVTAVGAAPLSYLWLRDGRLASAPCVTDATLRMTNLTTTENGSYAVVVSNGSGSVTSRVCRLIVLGSFSSTSLFPEGSAWRYNDQGLDLGELWRGPSYDDSAWSIGAAPLGFGNGDERTLLGGDVPEKPHTVYFRLNFVVPDGGMPGSVTGHLRCDDGAVVYLNGVEIFRHNLPAGDIRFGTSALTPVEGSDETAFRSFSMPGDLLQPGTNVLAVEIHQHVGTTGPVAFWTFDEPASPWQDSVGSHEFGLVGTNLFSWPGRVEGCVSNGTSITDYLAANDAPELRYSGPFTVGGWFAFGAGTDLEATCLQKPGEFRLYYTGSGINRYRFELAGSSVQDQTSATAAGQWRFVLGWYDGTNASIQVDNGPIQSIEAPQPEPTTNPLVALKRVGASGGLAADEVFLFRRLLSTGERTTLYTAGLRLVLATNVEDLSFDFELAGVTAQLPQFLAAPTGLMKRAGDSAAFSLTAASSTPVTYQWNFNSLPLPGATNSLLFLNAVTANHAGAYSLTASNIGGAVTSAPATLQVIEPPQLAVEWLPDNSSFRLRIPAHAVPCTLLVSTNLVDWVEQITWLPSPHPTDRVVSDATEAASRFYRLRLEL